MEVGWSANLLVYAEADEKPGCLLRAVNEDSAKCALSVTSDAGDAPHLTSRP